MVHKKRLEGDIDMVYTQEELRQIYDKKNGYCWHCGKKLAFTNYGKYGEKGAWEVDHSRSKNKGGTDYFRNLVPSCIECNRSKGYKNSHEFEPERKREEKDECFIATAAYGSPMAQELYILRSWRDNELSSIYIGRIFIRIYYTISPPIARFIEKHNILKILVRKLLSPLIKILKN